MQPIVLAFITGLTTGGLSCLAVQGGLLAGSIASEVEQSVQNQPASVQRVKVGTAPQPQQMQPRASRPILLFLTAKLIAYTLLGFMLGLLGAVLQLTPMMRAILLTAIGIFMIGSALRMLNVHPIFRYFIIEPPSSVTRYIRRKSKGQANALTPLFLGALTVLIPCGVTQAMMAVAMGTGNPWTGAAIMFAFVLGTSPVFFTVAYLTTRLGARLEKNFVRIVAVILLVLGLISIDSGLTLAGFPYSVANLRMAAGGSEPAPVAASAQPQAQEAAPQAQNSAPAQDQKPLHDTGKSDLTGAFGPAAAAERCCDHQREERRLPAGGDARQARSAVPVGAGDQRDLQLLAGVRDPVAEDRRRCCRRPAPSRSTFPPSPRAASSSTVARWACTAA